MRRRGRSISIASSEVWTRESWVATSWRIDWLSRRSWAATPRTARWAWTTSSSSCWLLRTFSERKRSKKSQRLSMAESRKTFGRAVLVGSRDALGQMSDQLGELVQKRLLGKLNGLIEARLHPLLLLPVEVRREPEQVVRRLDVRDSPRRRRRGRPASPGSPPGCTANQVAEQPPA